MIIKLFSFMLIVISLKVLFHKQYDLRDLMVDISCCFSLYYFINIVYFIMSILLINLWFNVLFENMYIKNRILIQRK